MHHSKELRGLAIDLWKSLHIEDHVSVHFQGPEFGCSMSVFTADFLPAALTRFRSWYMW